MRWNLNIILTCIAFMARNIEHFILTFFSHLDFFLLKSSIQFIFPFLQWVIDFLGV
jgi:hypothetical protein